MPDNLLSDKLIHDHNDHEPYVPACSTVVIVPNEETLQEELSLFEVIDVSRTFGVKQDG